MGKLEKKFYIRLDNLPANYIPWAGGEGEGRGTPGEGHLWGQLMLQGSAVGVSGSVGLQMTTGHGVIIAPGLIYAFGCQV